MSLTNEVRIGNWVEIEYSKEVRYTTIQPSCFSVNIDKFYLPIPLDEDWLLKFGFEKSEELFRLDKYWVEFRNFDSCGIRVLFGCFQFQKIYITKSVDTIKYVHQLQNLYFAITGSELQFNNDQPNL
jgi:hypothetical protein